MLQKKDEICIRFHKFCPKIRKIAFLHYFSKVLDKKVLFRVKNGKRCFLGYSKKLLVGKMKRASRSSQGPSPSILFCFVSSKNKLVQQSIHKRLLFMRATWNHWNFTHLNNNLTCAPLKKTFFMLMYFLVGRQGSKRTCCSGILE